jgi:hypothetical protein
VYFFWLYCVGDVGNEACWRWLVAGSLGSSFLGARDGVMSSDVLHGSVNVILPLILACYLFTVRSWARLMSCYAPSYLFRSVR